MSTGFYLMIFRKFNGIYCSNGSGTLMKQIVFNYDGAVYAVVYNSQTFIKKVHREKDSLYLVSIKKIIKILKHLMMKILILLEKLRNVLYQCNYLKNKKKL